uniref:Uncharacterized protein n=1 Tax=Arundo donax TaxID=35708 RepID=A0A0A9DCZ0_ARUDO
MSFRLERKFLNKLYMILYATTRKLTDFQMSFWVTTYNRESSSLGRNIAGKRFLLIKRYTCIYCLGY